MVEFQLAHPRQTMGSLPKRYGENTRRRWCVMPDCDRCKEHMEFADYWKSLFTKELLCEELLCADCARELRAVLKKWWGEKKK